MGGLSIFLFKEKSRNQTNNNRKDGYFCQHYHQMFGMKLPHQDTVEDVLRELSQEELDQTKMDLMSNLFEQKWLREYRLLNKYYTIAVDATGVVSFDKPHCEHCLSRKSKNGKVTYFHYVLEAKLVTEDGHCISLCTEWIENPTGDFDKQDCERKAFIRLAAKLKKQYPRLPVCILADGLYPYENAFKICEEYGWRYIFVLQNDSLKTVQEVVDLTRLKPPVLTCFNAKKGYRITREYRFETQISYHQKHVLNWIQCLQTVTQISKPEKNVEPRVEKSCFEYVTNIEVKRENVQSIVSAGRLRWKIENEGFNTQKCGDYELCHKYSEKSYQSLQNYYSLLQIAHAINQLVEKEKVVSELLKIRPKETIQNLWYKLKGFMIFVKPLPIEEADFLLNEELNPVPT